MVKCNCTTAEKPVSVRDYFRFRFGKWEYVRSHCRRLPGRLRRHLGLRGRQISPGVPTGTPLFTECV